jgi:hypothetical protein
MRITRSAGVYKLDDTLFIHSFAETVNGGWLEFPPVFAVPVNSNLNDIGNSIQKALAASRKGVPFPRNWNEVKSPVLHVAGAASADQFEATALSCSIDTDGTQIRFTPNRNLVMAKTGFGFEPINDSSVEIPSHSPLADIGTALLCAVDCCE